MSVFSLPIANVPELTNVIWLSIVPPAFKATFVTFALIDNVSAVTAPLNVTVPPSVIVNVSIFVIAPENETSASSDVPASIVKFWPAASTLVTAANSILPEPLVESIVKVLASWIVIVSSMSTAPVTVIVLVKAETVPVTLKLLRAVTVSVASSPNTALPVIVKLSTSPPPSPATAPLNVTVEPCKVIKPSLLIVVFLV